MSVKLTPQTILLNDYTGDPYINEEGELVLINDTAFYRQTIDVFLMTTQGEDILARRYGLDLNGLADGKYGDDWQTSTTVMMMESINKNDEPAISDVKWVDVQKGSEAYSIDITVSIEVNTGEEIVTNIELGD